MTPRPDWLLCRPEHKAVIKPVIAHEQVTGKLFVIEIGLCELRQVVTFLYNFIGEIFFIVIFPLIFIPEITYKNDEIRHLRELQEINDLQESDIELSCSGLGIESECMEYFTMVLTY